MSRRGGRRHHRVHHASIVDHRRRTVHHQDRVLLRVGLERAQRRRIAGAVGVAQDVDRDPVRPGRWQDAVELGADVRRQLGQPPAQRLQRVCGQHARAAAIGQDGQAVAPNGQPAGQRLRRLEQLVQAFDAQHAGAPESRIVDRVGSGQSAGVRQRGLRAGGAAAGLDDDHRLGARGDAGGAHELARLGDRFDIQQDRARRGIQRQPVQHVAEVDIGHVAQRGDVGEAQVAPDRPVEHRRHQGAGLRDEGDVAGARRKVGETGVDADAWRQETQAIGSDDAQHVRPRGVQHRLAEIRPGAFLALAEPGGDHDRRAAAALAQLGDQLGRRGGRRGQHGQIRGEGKLRDRRIAQDRADRRLVRTDREDRPGEAAGVEVARDRPADRALAIARADERDCLRPEERVEVAGAHALCAGD